MSEAKSQTPPTEAGSEAAAAESATKTATTPAAKPQQQQQEQQVAEVEGGKQLDQAATSSTKKRKPLNSSSMNKVQEKPLILEQATLDSVPLHLQQLMAQYEQRRKLSSAETLMLLIYLVALESGFVEEEVYAEKRHLLKPVPSFSSFHAANVRLLSLQPAFYSVEFDDTVFLMKLRTLQDKNASQEAAIVATLRSRLMVVVLGDQLMVTLSPLPPSKEPGYSISLSIGRYVLNVQLKNKPIFHRFRKLDELSFQLKQQVFQPMRSQQLMQMEQHLQPSLVGLPDEMYAEIFRHLNRNQLNIVANVNRKLSYYSKQHKEHRKKQENRS